MREILVIIVLTIFAIPANAQYTNDTAGWCPPGATWVYRQNAQASDAYMVMQYQKDTVISGDTAKEMAVTYLVYYTGPATRVVWGHDLAYYKLKGDSLYYLNGSMFDLACIFNQNAGSNFVLNYRVGTDICHDSSKIQSDTLTVSQVVKDTFGNLIFERQKVQPSGRWWVGDILNHIGGLISPYPSTACATNLGFKGLVCYSDNIRGYIYRNNKIIGNVGTCYDLATGLQEAIDTRTAITVYPNPCTDKIQLAGFSGIANVSIRDVNGKIIATKNLVADQSWDVSQLPPGLYFISIKSGPKFLTSKFLKI
ncbi:MAG: T9SS type A sorting domain-containing protein [Chitinophagales bacterium]